MRSTMIAFAGGIAIGMLAAPHDVHAQGLIGATAAATGTIDATHTTTAGMLAKIIGDWIKGIWGGSTETKTPTWVIFATVALVSPVALGCVMYAAGIDMSMGPNLMKSLIGGLTLTTATAIGVTAWHDANKPSADVAVAKAVASIPACPTHVVCPSCGTLVPVDSAAPVVTVPVPPSVTQPSPSAPFPGAGGGLASGGPPPVAPTAPAPPERPH